MDQPLQVSRTTDDLTDATILAMKSTGAWSRHVATNRRSFALAFVILGVAGSVILNDVAFAVTAVAVAALAIWLTPRLLERTVRRRLPAQLGDQVESATGLQTLWITDNGLSDSGSGITTTIAWDRITHHVVTPDRHMFCAGLAAVIDIPRRGDTAAVDQFAAHADHRMATTRTPIPA